MSGDLKRPRSFPRQVRDVHRLVNEARLRQGKPPVEFTRGTRPAPENGGKLSLPERLAKLPADSLVAEILTERIRRSLNVSTAAKEIGMKNACTLDYIERSAKSTVALNKHAEAIRRWLAISKTK